MDKMLTRLAPLAVLTAFALATLAILEALFQALGGSLLKGVYSAGRLLEFAGIAMLFAVGLTLREILAELRRRAG